ncbi:transglutaminase domain-containing protein [Candidatus Kapabacteria bacterium]|nr:transglutaminase domain-containing protein [Candidatus Kapabacteria bacterium]
MKLMIALIIFCLNITSATIIDDALIKGDRESIYEVLLNESKNGNVEADALLISMYGKYYYKIDLEKHLQNILNNENASSYFISIHDKLYISTFGDSANDEVIDLLENALEEQKLNASANGIISDLLKRYYNSTRQYKKQSDIIESICVIKNWSAVGEFENISGSGFDNNFGPLENPKVGTKFKSKTNFMVDWFELPTKQNKLWTFMNYYLSHESSIIFAQSYIKSEFQQELVLRLGTSGSVKAYLNDQLVFSEKEERNNNIDTYLAKVQLNKGWNRILLQLGSSEIDDNNFTLRFTKDNKAVQLESSANYKEYKKSDNEITIIDNPAELFFKSKINKNESIIANSYLLNQVLVANQKFKESRNVLIGLEKSMGESPILKRELIELYSKSGKRTLHSLELEKLRKSAPNDPISLELEYSDFYEAENYDKCDEIITKMENLFNDFIDQSLYVKKISLAYKRKEFDRRRDLIFEAYDKYPNNSYYVRSVANHYASQLKDVKKAIDILDDYLDNTFSLSFMNEYAKLQSSQGNTETALEIYNEILENDKNYPGTYSKIAAYYEDLHLIEEAKQYYNDAFSMKPQSTYLISQIANLEKEYGDKNKASKLYKLITDIYPYSYSSLEQLRLINGENSIWEMFEKPDLNAIYSDNQSHMNLKDENIEILHNEVQSVKYENGGFIQKYFFLAKAINKDGTDILQEYYIPHYGNQKYNIELAEVLKADGTNLRAEQNSSQLVFTNLEEGDAVKIIYTISTSQYPTLIGHYWDKMYFNTYFPSKKVKYTLAIEGESEFKYLLSNSDLKPTINSKNNFKIYTWEMENIPPIKYENFMPYLDDIGIVLNYSSIPDWNYINKWYQRLAQKKADDDIEVKQVIKNLFNNNLKDFSDIQKARIIYDYVVNNIRYSSINFRQSGLIPQKASNVINTKIGDCKDVSTLFVSLCNEVGIDANLVLVNTRENGEKSMPLPSIDFNHCIASLQLNDSDYYIELTSDKLPFASYDFSLKNSITLDINKEVSGIKKLDPKTRKSNFVIRNTVMNLDNSKAEILTKTIKAGGEAARMRSSFSSLSEVDRFKAMQDAVSGSLPSVKLKELNLDNIGTTQDSVSYSYIYESKDPYTSIGNMEIIKVPWTDVFEFSEIVSQENRKYPLALWMVYNSDFNEENFTINIPDGKKLIEMPNNVSISNEIFDYNISFEQKANKLICRRFSKMKSDIVSPEQYSKFKLDFEKIMKADKTQIAITNIK